MMNMRTRQTFLWFTEQCPRLDSWLKDSPVAEYITSIRVYELANKLIHVEFKTAVHQFSIITAAEAEPAASLLGFSLSARYGDRPMSSGSYSEATWLAIEKDIHHIIQSGTSRTCQEDAEFSYTAHKE